MSARTIVHFEIPADDPEKLSKFYGEAFGWAFQKIPMGEMTYWYITTGPQGESVTGGMYSKMRPDDRPRNFVRVEEIDAAIGQFLGAGGRELVSKREVPGQGWSFIGLDPEGNPIALWEPKMPAPTRPRRRAAPRRAPRRKTGTAKRRR